MNTPDFRTPFVARQQKQRANQPADMAAPRHANGSIAGSILAWLLFFAALGLAVYSLGHR